MFSKQLILQKSSTRNLTKRATVMFIAEVVKCEGFRYHDIFNVQSDAVVTAE